MVHKRNGLKSNQCFESGSAGIRHESGTLIRRAKMARKKKKKQLNFKELWRSWGWIREQQFDQRLESFASCYWQSFLLADCCEKLPNTFTCLLEYPNLLGISCLPPSHLAKCGKLAWTANILPPPPTHHLWARKQKESFLASVQINRKIDALVLYNSVVDPWHFGTDPRIRTTDLDPGIRTTDLDLDPDPALWVRDLRDVNKIYFFCLILRVKKNKEVTKH